MVKRRVLSVCFHALFPALTLLLTRAGSHKAVEKNVEDSISCTAADNEASPHAASLLQSTSSMTRKVGEPGARQLPGLQLDEFEFRDSLANKVTGLDSAGKEDHVPRTSGEPGIQMDSKESPVELYTESGGAMPGASSTGELRSTDHASMTAASRLIQAFQRFQTRLKIFAMSLTHEVEWFVEEVSENGFSKRSSGVLILLVFIALMLMAFYFCLIRNTASVQLETPVLSGPHGTLRSPEVTPNASSRSPDGVMADECECIIAVPVYAPSGSFAICDTSGRPVLHGFAQTSGRSDLRYENLRPLWRLNLKTSRGDSFAQCIEMMPSTASLYGVSVTGLEFHILDAKGEYFASLVQLQLPHGQQRFQITTQEGDKLHAWGNFQTQAVNITDEQGSLLAATDPYHIASDQSRSYYRLRVPRVSNAGLPLCALLCIGQVLKLNPSTAK
jgi:hypothetical protein